MGRGEVLLLRLLRGRGSGRGRGGSLVLPASTSHWDIPERASLSPVPPATLAEVPGLGEAVVVVVTELGVGGGTPGALQGLLRMRRELPILLLLSQSMASHCLWLMASVGNLHACRRMTLGEIKRDSHEKRCFSPGEVRHEG